MSYLMNTTQAHMLRTNTKINYLSIVLCAEYIYICQPKQQTLTEPQSPRPSFSFYNILNDNTFMNRFFISSFKQNKQKKKNH